MRILHSFILAFLLVAAAVAPARSQDAPSGGAPAQSTAAPDSTASQSAASLGDVLDRVVQRKHLFLAQMRHMHPMVETYIQDLKADSNGDPQPIRDHYFLGRLDMTDGPEDTSFTGQPGFGQRMLTKLTGVYSMHFLPLGFAQMVVLDTDFQKKYYNFTFVRREFLGEIRCLVVDAEPKEGARAGRFKGRAWGEEEDSNVV